MDTDRGRRAVGGKIEIRLKIREPLTDKDVQIENWRWLVIDMHIGGRRVCSTYMSKPNMDILLAHFLLIGHVGHIRYLVHTSMIFIISTSMCHPGIPLIAILDIS